MLKKLMKNEQILLATSTKADRDEWINALKSAKGYTSFGPPADMTYSKPTRQSHSRSNSEVTYSADFQRRGQMIPRSKSALSDYQDDDAVSTYSAISLGDSEVDKDEIKGTLSHLETLVRNFF
jgi:hypothetical protein